MKNIHIFKVGKHTSAAGNEIDFSESMLQGVASSYDKNLHKAPVIVGHNEGASPAFGWIGGVEFSEGGLYAKPEDLNSDFVEMVKNGSYKKVSASFYSPESKTNPTPGTMHLRHLAFLGAQPPAVKGLEEVSFSEDDGSLSVDADFDYQEDKGLMQSIADSVKTLLSRTEKLESKIEFKENQKGDDVTREEELQAALDAANAEKDKLAKANEKLNGQVADFSEQSAADKKAKLNVKVSALVQSGKVLPKHKSTVLAFFENIEAGKTIEFGEGDDKKETSLEDLGFAMFEEMKPQVSFGEQSGDDGQGAKIPTGEEIRDYCEKNPDKTTIQAFNALQKGDK